MQNYDTMLDLGGQVLIYLAACQNAVLKYIWYSQEASKEPLADVNMTTSFNIKVPMSLHLLGYESFYPHVNKLGLI